jgi:hypothetical protein
MSDVATNEMKSIIMIKVMIISERITDQKNDLLVFTSKITCNAFSMDAKT